MKPLTIQCPITAEVIETDVGGSYEDLEQKWDRYLTIRCPHCGGTHGFVVREAFNAETLAGEVMPALHDVTPAK